VTAAPSLTAGGRDIALELHGMLRELDPARWRAEARAATAERLTGLAQRTQALLESTRAARDGKAAELRARLAAMRVSLEAQAAELRGGVDGWRGRRDGDITAVTKFEIAKQTRKIVQLGYRYKRPTWKRRRCALYNGTLCCDQRGWFRSNVYIRAAWLRCKRKRHRMVLGYGLHWSVRKWLNHRQPRHHDAGRWNNQCSKSFDYDVPLMRSS
jgi:hypothetical protein